MVNTQQITVQPNEPFVWSKNLKLSPVSAVTIVLPGGLVRKDEEVRSVIEVSDDDAEIGFEKSETPDEPFCSIILKIAPGVSVRLKRATQAIVVQDSKEPVVFRVEG